MKSVFTLLTVLFLLLVNFHYFALSDDKDKAQQFLSSQGIEFIENRGQFVDSNGKAAKDILYVADVAGKKIYVRKSGISYVLSQLRISNYELRNNTSLLDPLQIGNKTSPPAPLQRRGELTVRIDMDILGMNPNAIICPEEKLESYNNYYLAHCPNGITHVPVYKKIVYENAYDNIDLVLYENKGEAEYDFVVKPGADPTKIRLDIKAADRVSVDGDGNLIIESALGKIEHIKPFTYQVVNGRQVEVKSSFNLSADGNVSFEVKNYDRSIKLVIDPLIKVWGTYYTGYQTFGHINNLSCDKYGNLYLTGQTYEDTEIRTTGCHQEKFGGDGSSNLIFDFGGDAFISKFDSSGKRLWSTYYGGDSMDVATGICCDPANNIIVTGFTNSKEAIATDNSYQKQCRNFDAFVAKFNQSGVRLWGTYFGGDSVERMGSLYIDDFSFDGNDDHTWRFNNISCDVNSNIYICGTTNSTDGISTNGAYKNKCDLYDAYLAKFSPSGNVLWATYYGGDSLDGGFSIACDTNSNVVLIGVTKSISGIASPGALQENIFINQRDYDNYFIGINTFIAKFNPTGRRLWGTYFGNGSAVGDVTDQITTDGDNIYVAGTTIDTTLITTPNAYKKKGGFGDSYLASLDPNGGLNWSTYFGQSPNMRSNFDYIFDVRVSNKGIIFISGSTESQDSIATEDSYQTRISDLFDGFLVAFDKQGRLLSGTYYGGDEYDRAACLACDSSGNVYIAGFSGSETGIATKGSFRDTISLNHYDSDYRDGFIARLKMGYPDISGDTVIRRNINNCFDYYKDSIQIFNKGDDRLVIDFTKSYFINSTPGLELIKPKTKVTVKPGDSLWVYIQYKVQNNVKLVSDTLVLVHNDTLDHNNLWKSVIHFNIDIFDITTYDVKSEKLTDSIYLGSICPGESAKGSFIVTNLSNSEITLVVTSLSDSKNFKLFGSNVQKLKKSGQDTFEIVFSSNKTGTYMAQVAFEIEECPNFSDTISVFADVLRTEIVSINQVDFSDVTVGQTAYKEAIIKNTGNTPALIDSISEPKAHFSITEIIPAIPSRLEPGGELKIKIKYSPENAVSDTALIMAFSVKSEYSCPDTAQIRVTGKGKPSIILLNKNELDFGELAYCSKKGDTLVVTNKGTNNISIIKDPYITGKDPSCFNIISYPKIPFILSPNQSVRYIVVFSDQTGIEGEKNAVLSIITDIFQDSIINIPLKAKVNQLLCSYNSADLGSCSINQNKNVPFSISNNSEFDFHINEVLVDNPDISVTPKDCIIKSNETGSFGISWLPKKSGTISSVIKFVISEPCPDTIVVPVNGEAIEGAVSVTTDIDLGTVAFCEEKTDSVVIVNTGETPIEIKEMAKSGTDASLFDFADNITLPKTLNKDEKLVRIIKYNGSSSTDGVKTAEIITKAVIDGVEKDYRTELRAERASIILSSAPAALNFPDTKPADKSTAKLNIRNDSKLPVTITGIKAKTYPAVYNIVPNSTALAPQEQKDIDIEFAPVLEGDYKDSLILKIKMSGCDGEYNIALNGKCVKDKDTAIVQPEYIGCTAYLPDTSAWVGDKDFGIPLMIKPDKDTTIKDLSYTAKIRFSATAYEPTSAVDAIFVNNKIVSGERIVELKGTKALVTKRDTVLGEMRGNVYLGLNDRTALILDDIKLSDSLIKVRKLNGELRVKGLCQQNLSKIKMMNELVLSVVPSPASDESEIVVTGDAKGVMSVAIYSIEGIKKGTIEIDKTGFEAKQKLNLKEYSSGVYQLILQSGGECLNVPMVVIK